MLTAIAARVHKARAAYVRYHHCARAMEVDCLGQLRGKTHQSISGAVNVDGHETNITVLQQFDSE